MIQRIQTLFLLGAGVILGLMLFLPLAELHTAEGLIYTARVKGLFAGESETVLDTWPLSILVLVTFCITLVNISWYKNRKLQIRLSVYGIILSFGIIGLLYFYWVHIARQIEISDFVLKLPLIFPVIAIILIYLAFRGIRRDEILVRSMDKIR